YFLTVSGLDGGVQLSAATLKLNSSFFSKSRSLTGLSKIKQRSSGKCSSTALANSARSCSLFLIEPQQMVSMRLKRLRTALRESVTESSLGSSWAHTSIGQVSSLI